MIPMKLTEDDEYTYALWRALEILEETDEYLDNQLEEMENEYE